MSQICYRWGFTNIWWNNANWTWSECQLVRDIVSGALPPDEWQKNKEKKKQLIRLICKVKKEYFDESKMVRDDLKVSVNDVKLVVKTMTGIELDIKM
mgnify:CR=1 FL=1